MEALSKDFIATMRKQSEESLFFFCRAILGFSDMEPHIHKPICDTLEDYKTNTRCLIVLPRDWFKSTIGSIGYPIWRACKNPNIRILIAQNSFTNATKKLNSIRQIFEKNELLRAIFPEVLPNSKCIWKDEQLMLNRTLAAPEGTFEAAGVGTAVISRHYDLVVEDDTVSPGKDSMTGIMQQPTRAEIEKAIGWHRLVHPLLLHPSRSQILIIGTRWADRDLIGWVLDESTTKTYKVITRAVREDKDGKPATKAEGGKAVWDRFNEEVLDELEHELGPYMFATLMMNKPTSATNQTFMLDWIKYYEKTPSGLLKFTSVDPAPPDSDSSSDPDYNVVITTGVQPRTGEIYVLEYWRQHADPGDVINEIFRQYRVHHPLDIRIEAVAYQKTLVYWIEQKQKKTGVQFGITAVPGSKTSKDLRIKGLQPFFKNGQVYIKVEHDELERELIGYRPGKTTDHDDIIDALSDQISCWNEVILSYEQEKKEQAKENPFTGRAILDSINDRVNYRNRYPNDLGNMWDREDVLAFNHYGRAM